VTGTIEKICNDRCRRKGFVGGESFLSLVLLLLLLSPTAGLAALVNTQCSECHTMHRSQQGLELSDWGTGGPHAALLVTDCAGCHMGVNVPGSMPYVLSAVAPIYAATGTEASTNTLAGGSFYWVAQGLADSKGHNVVGVTTPDATLTVPPGFNGARTAYDGSQPGGGSWPDGQQVTCAGVYGCHGTHMESGPTKAIQGGHHTGLTGAIELSSAEPARGFRFLVGVLGYEDPEWELTPTASAHNQYKGTDRTIANTTISSLCARCHGDFHQQAGFDVWTTHPVDYDLSHTDVDSEYRQYGGATHIYQPDVPLASSNVGTPLATVSLMGGDAIISCVSCHRAHGSPYEKLLRWDYAGSSGAGCVVCHTSKS
jgi:predicted CXXCH cytochrome family protein